MNQTELEALVLRHVEPGDEIELPQVVYDADGDCIEFLIANEEFYAERLDNMFTVYIGRDGQQVVGTLIKGVHAIIKGILKKYPGFSVDFRDGKVRLEHLFTARLWEGGADHDTMHVHLLKLRDVADKASAEVEVELCEA